MYQRKNRLYCTVMLLVSMGLRIAMLLGADEYLKTFAGNLVRDRNFTKTLLFLETGQWEDVPEEPEKVQPVVVYLEDPIPKEPVTLEVREPLPEPEPLPPEPEPLPPLLPTALAEAGCLQIVGGCTYDYDRETLRNRPTAMDFSGEGPKILILHAHTTEAYTPEPGWEYTPTTPYRTLDPARSVVAVGEALAQKLEAEGFSVAHDTTVHDDPDYNSSYWNTLQTINGWKERYPDIQMIIDVHRDAAEDSSGRPLALCSDQGAVEAAQVMLVVGTCQGGLEHPNWEENLANGLKLQSVLDGMYPGLCRKLDLRQERFNQHTAPGAILVEVGTHGNTLRQALAAADLLGDSLARMLNALEFYGGTLEPQDLS